MRAFVSRTLMTVTAAMAVVALTAPVAAADDAPASDWMSTVYSTRDDVTLAEMVIPGTHDSGAFAIATTPPCSNTAIAGTSQAVASALAGNPCVGAGLSRAQDRTLAEQLTDGIRYLDMRVGVPEDRVVSRKRARKGLTAAQAARVPLVLQHTLASQRLTEAIADVVRFAKAHPREQVILDFQHVDLTGVAVIDDYYIQALDLVLRRFRVDGTTVCSRAWSRSAIPVTDSRLGTGVPLRQAWAADRNLIVLRAAGELPDRGCYRSREAALWSPWPNTADPAASVAANEDYLRQRSQALADQGSCTVAEGNRCGMFVSQLQLSVQLATQVGCLMGTTTQGCSLAELAGLVNPQVPQLLEQWRFTESLPVNIAIVDFYSSSSPSYTASLIAMNQRIAAEG